MTIDPESIWQHVAALLFVVAVIELGIAFLIGGSREALADD